MEENRRPYPDVEERTQIFLSSACGGDIEAMRAQVMAGFDLNGKDRFGDTILERGLLIARGGGMSKRIGWVPFADPIMITLAFVTRRDAPLSPAARVMVELVEERLRATAAELAKTPRKRLPS